jgi:hypothetical protein
MYCVCRWKCMNLALEFNSKLWVTENTWRWPIMVETCSVNEKDCCIDGWIFVPLLVYCALLTLAAMFMALQWSLNCSSHIMLTEPGFVLSWAPSTLSPWSQYVESGEPSLYLQRNLSLPLHGKAVKPAPSPFIQYGLSPCAQHVWLKYQGPSTCRCMLSPLSQASLYTLTAYYPR